MYPGTWAQKAPHRPAVVMASTGEIITYRQLDERSNRLAHLWRGRGLRRGDHVAVVLDNHPRFLEITWAALRSGLVITPVNWHLTPAELDYVLTDCGARSVVTSRAFAASVTAVVDPAHVLVVDDVEGIERFEDSVAAMPSTPVDDEWAGTDMIYSSGTTGRPKGGVRPLPDFAPADMPESRVALLRMFGMGEDTVYLSPGAPLYHAAPLRFCIGVQTVGGTVVLMERFDPAAALRAIDDHEVTHSQWVPTMFVRMLRLPDDVRAAHKGHAHRVAIHGAAPCPVGVKERMIEWWGPIITEYYGGSEGGSITSLTAEEWLAHRGSVGRAVIGEVHVVDDEGNELPPGELGIVRFGGGVPISYHNDPDKTAAAHDRNGWSTLGDMGHLDEDGYLYLTDRKDFMIVSGGVNIYPQETEDVLLQHPKVADVAVFGVPSEEFGEEVKAVVEPIDLADAGPELAEELLAFCRERLAAYKCPRSVDFDPKLPRSPAGKLYKRLLRDRYWEGHTSRVV